MVKMLRIVRTLLTSLGVTTNPRMRGVHVSLLRRCRCIQVLPEISTFLKLSFQLAISVDVVENNKHLKAASARTVTSSSSSSSSSGSFSLCNLNNDSCYRSEESTPIECVTQRRNPAFRCFSDHSFTRVDRKHVDTYRT
ncbi:hypothetical protein EXN66_Car020725 [Channa argus]|uniref:Uncharacterized protein n=1 Tax=Channa argus TaxID=215402 RepID=A0A6G1QRC2_CHAAH|nr:hypothetical protein EXN66_Car020725 [Channa argus]